jgi:hypothetical protein
MLVLGSVATIKAEARFAAMHRIVRSRDSVGGTRLVWKVSLRISKFINRIDHHNS